MLSRLGIWRWPIAAVLGLALLSVALPTLMSRRETPAQRTARPASDPAAQAQARTDMMAGCTDQGAPRSYCECITERVLGHDAAHLRAFEAGMDRMRPGSPPPAILVEASQACARPG